MFSAGQYTHALAIHNVEVVSTSAIVGKLTRKDLKTQQLVAAAGGIVLPIHPRVLRHVQTTRPITYSSLVGFLSVCGQVA